MANEMIEIEEIRIYNKSDSYENWKNNNPVLGPGEIGMESDTFRTKMGDGSTSWNALPYTNYTEFTGLEILCTNSTPTILAKLPANFYINTLSVSIDEEWSYIDSLGNVITDTISISIGTDSDSSSVLESDMIDLTDVGSTYIYKINKLITSPTELKIFIRGTRNTGKLTINIK